ncbi:MAG: SDR family NAD(P)-dependent oxidoreductase, partial [Candidatus Promineifilaceae bacterium]
PLLLGRRDWSTLTELAGEFPAEAYCRADLGQVDCVEKVTAFLAAQGIQRVDLVIHNAGAGFYGRPETQSADSIDQLINVNLVAPIVLTKALRPYLPDGSGQVVFVSSVAADLPAPDYAVYVATKAALDDFARNLRTEWGDKFVVQSIHPGATRTGMHGKMGISAETLNTDKFPPAATVAAQIAQAIAQKRASPTVGVNNKVLGFVGRNLGWAIDPLMRRGQAKYVGAFRRTASERKRCVITGAADGIGRALAQRYAAAGYQVIGIDVDAARAEQVAAELENVSFVIGDLSSAEDLQKIIAALSYDRPIDVLIHNAGISAVGRFDKVPIAKQQKVIDINLRAPLRLTAGLLATSALRSDASLVFISSLSKQLGYPGAAVYAATKAGLAAYARSLRAAFGGQKHVLTVYPGPTRTAHARRYSPDNSREGKRMTPEKLADLIFGAVKKRRSELIPSAGNRVAAIVGHVAPRLVDAGMKKVMLDGLDDRVLVE